MPTIVKGYIVEDAYRYDGDDNADPVLLEQLCHARAKHSTGTGAKETRHSGAHVRKLVSENR
jgi:hypothetical protein